MTLLVQHQLILAKVETTKGTDAAPTAATNSILVQDISWSQKGLRMEKRPAIRGTSIAMLQPVYAGELCQIDFTCELKGSGTKGTVPEIDPLLQACAMAETTVAATSCTYNPTSVTADIKSVTIWHEADGVTQKLTGCMGTVNFDIKAGMIPTAKFTFTGHVESRSDIALDTGTFNQTIPPAAISVICDIGAYEPVLTSLTLDIGTKVEMPANIGAVDGYAPLMISERDVKGTLDVEADILTNINFFTDLSTDTKTNFTSGAIGATAGNIVTLNCPQFVVTGIKPGKTEGILTYTIDFAAVESSTVDTDFNIVFT